MPYKTGSWGKQEKERSRGRKDYFREYQREYQRRLRPQVIAKLGGKCAHCGFSDPRALQIDHIRGNGTEERKKRGHRAGYLVRVLRSLENKEGKYQLLCANCNWIKRYENNEIKGRG